MTWCDLICKDKRYCIFNGSKSTYIFEFNKNDVYCGFKWPGKIRSQSIIKTECKKE